MTGKDPVFGPKKRCEKEKNSSTLVPSYDNSTPEIIAVVL